MIPRVEHIGQSSSVSWPKRFRRWLSDLFGSRYAQLLERELLQARLDKDRQIAELRADRDRLMVALMAVKGVPLAPILPAPVRSNEPKKTELPQTNWQRLQAEAIAENARAEAAEKIDVLRAGSTENVKEN